MRRLGQSAFLITSAALLAPVLLVLAYVASILTTALVFP
jgi:hypothetical protein